MRSGERRFEEEIEFHANGGENLGDAVVEIGGEAAAFGFLDLEDAWARERRLRL